MNRFLTGLAAGLAIGYLTAPRTGKQTRDRFSQSVDKQSQGLREQWDKTVAQTNQLIDTAKSAVGASKPEPNLFADMESGKMDKYLDKTDIARRKVKEGYNNRAEDTADAAYATLNKAKEALKQ